MSCVTITDKVIKKHVTNRDKVTEDIKG